MRPVPDIPETVLSAPFVHDGGLRFGASVPDELRSFTSDAGEDSRASRLRLYENGVELRRPHASHSSILDSPGHYSHWDSGILFATSDGSSPNENGRRYSVRVHEAAPRVFAFGTCHIQDAVIELHNQGRIDAIRKIPSYSHYTAEILQQIAYYNCEKEIPPDLLPFIMNYPTKPRPSPSLLANADIVLMEICTPFQIRLGDYFLNRTQVQELLTNALQTRGDDVREMSNGWFFNGILKQDETTRDWRSQALLEALQASDAPYGETDLEIIREARGFKQTREALKADLAEIRDRLNKPLAIYSHILRYMPDGRPVSWPGEFYGQVNDIGRELGIAVSNPSELVVKRGVEFALTPDLSHYTEPFVHVLAEEMAETIIAVKNG
jgi:hypothetical protein